MLRENDTISEGSECRTLGSSVAKRFSEAVFSESKTGYRWAGRMLLALFATLALVFVLLGAPPLAGGPWDTATILDGGWRIVNGQVPHTDFHVPLGSLTYLLAAFGMVVAPPSTASITYGNMLLLALLLPAAWYLASARFSWFITSIFVVFEGFYLATPRPPGYPTQYTSYAMIYNRHGYVMLALLFLCVFLKRRKPSRWSDLLEGLLTGALLALLLYCKITYFVAGAAISALGVVFNPQPRRWFHALTGAFACICLAFGVLFHISLYAYFMDIVTAGHAQSAVMRFSLLSQGFHSNFRSIYLLAFSLVLCSWAQEHTSSRSFPVLRLWLVAGSILATSLWILSGNASQGGGADDPMYFLALVIILELFLRQNPGSITQENAKARWTYIASLVLLVPVFWLPILVREVESCGHMIAWDVIERPSLESSMRIHSKNLRDFCVEPTIVRDTAYWTASEFPTRINSGIDLLRSNLQPGDRVTTFTFSNPFSFALGTPPANDGPLWWDLNISFSRTHYPPVQEFLGHATLVIVPRLMDRSSGCCFSTPDLMLELYGDYLHGHFREIASTDTWILYRRVTE